MRERWRRVAGCTVIALTTAIMAACTGDQGVAPDSTEPAMAPSHSSGAWQVATSDDTWMPDYWVLDSDMVAGEVIDATGLSWIVADLQGQQYTLPVDEGWIPQPGLRADDRLIFGLGNEETGDFLLVTWAPELGEVNELFAHDYWSEIAVVGETLYYTQWTQGEQGCVRATSLSGPADDREVFCEPHGDGVFWLTATDDHLSVMSTLDEDYCGQVFSTALPDEEFSLVDTEGCANRAVAAAAGVAWTDSPVDGEETDYSSVDLTASIGGGAPTALGRASTGSTVWCGGELYWLAEHYDGEHVASEIRTWDGDGAAQTIYEAPNDELPQGEEYATSRPRCGGGGQVWFLRWSAVTGQEVLSSEPIDWQPVLQPPPED